jgi:negative regulator of flagellin synthesis FlgM
MKIGPIETKPAVAAPSDRKSAPSQGSQAAEPSAQVELSSAAANVSGAGDGSFDAHKVANISQAIREGHFKVNPEAIADKLIENASELLTRKTS